MPKKKDDSAVDEELYRARRKVIAALPDIVSKLIDKAKEGSYQHARFLLDFAGEGPSDESGADANDDSLAALLMKELKEPSA